MTTRAILQLQEDPYEISAVDGYDVLWSPASVAAGAGRLSSILDLGPSPRPRRYLWLASTRWVAAPAANDRWSLYLIEAAAAADPTLTVGAFTPGDAALTTENELLANAQPFGVVLATATDKLFIASGVVEINHRYCCFAGWNGSATKALTAAAADHFLLLYPLADQLQPEV